MCIRDSTIPVLFGKPGFQLDSEGNANLDLDVFGSAFFMLSRYEEAVLTDRDIHDRFPAAASIAYKAGFLERPIIDEYGEILWSAIHRVWPGTRRRRRQSRTLVSHDVDKPSLHSFHSLRRMLRISASDLLKRHDLRRAIHGPWIWANSRRKLHPDDPYNTFEWIMDISERYGLTSAFYFICGRTHPTLDALYEIEHPAIRALMRQIRERGHELGLHASYNSYQNPDVVAAEAARMKQVCEEEGIEQSSWGGRMHYLRWETPTTLYGWERANMTYDSTLGYADRAGFRCGTCQEYPAFDPVRRVALNLLVRPLIAMESTIMAEKYMGMGDSSAAFNEFVKLKSACRIVGGNFTLLWHNSSFGGPRAKSLYESVISE